MHGRRVAVTVDGEEYLGTVADVTYTVKGGQPVLRVSLDESLPDGRGEFLADPETVEPR